MSQTFRFRMSRADWVALSSTVARRPLMFRLAVVVTLVSMVVIVLSMLSSKDPESGSMLHEAMKGGPDWYPFFGLMALVALGTVFRHHLVGFNARMGFARLPLADKELTVAFGPESVHVTAPEASGFDWTFPWAAVGRVIETPTHLVLATGGREGLPIPRAAFANDAAFEAVRKTVLARVPQGASHERA